MIVAGNWKMFTGPDPDALAARLTDVSGVDVIVCPPYVSLASGNLCRTISTCFRDAGNNRLYVLCVDVRP